MISERRLMVMLRWEDCPQETALTWRLAHRRMTSGARKHDDSVNVDSPHGRDRRKARATQARSAKGMEAEVAPEAASGGAVHARRMARIGGRGAPRVAQDRAYHCTPIRRAGAWLCVHLRARDEICLVGGPYGRASDRWRDYGLCPVDRPEVHASRSSRRPSAGDAPGEMGRAAARPFLLRLFLTLSRQRERQVGPRARLLPVGASAAAPGPVHRHSRGSRYPERGYRPAPRRVRADGTTHKHSKPPLQAGGRLESRS